MEVSPSPPPPPAVKDEAKGKKKEEAGPLVEAFKEQEEALRNHPALLVAQLYGLAELLDMIRPDVERHLVELQRKKVLEAAKDLRSDASKQLAGGQRERHILKTELKLEMAETMDTKGPLFDRHWNAIHKGARALRYLATITKTAPQAPEPEPETHTTEVKGEESNETPPMTSYIPTSTPRPPLQTPRILEGEHDRPVEAKTRAPSPLSLDEPKTLVVVIGQVRGGELAWRSLRRNVLLSEKSADLALMVSPQPNSTLLHEWAKYVWRVSAQDEQDWGSVLDRAAQGCSGGKGHGWRRLCNNERPDPARRNQFLGGAGPECKQLGSAGILLGLRFLVREKIRELGLDKKYDAFLLTRADELYLCPHPSLGGLNPEKLWVMQGEEYGGVSDRHTFGRTPLFMRSLDVVDRVICEHEDFEREIVGLDHVNLEKVLARWYSRSNLTWAPFERVAFTVRAPGDPTRWGQGERIDEGLRHQLLIKYSTEFWEARNVCNTTLDDVASSFT